MCFRELLQLEPHCTLTGICGWAGSSEHQFLVTSFGSLRISRITIVRFLVSARLESHFNCSLHVPVSLKIYLPG